MIKERLPMLRLVIYLIILGVCGFVTLRELFYALGGDTTTATVRSVSKTSASRRTATFVAEYEYTDAGNNRHVGKANVHPTTRPFDVIEIQYLLHAPQISRPAPSPAGGLCFGTVALLALAAFLGEIAVRRRRQGSESDS